MTTISPEKSDELAIAEEAIRDARQRHETLAAEQKRRLEDQRPLIREADEADVLVPQLETQRQLYLVPALRDKDETAIDKLRELDAAIERVKKRAQDSRAAAALLEPGIAELAPQLRAAAMDIRVAIFHHELPIHRGDGERIHAALDAVMPFIERWRETDADVREHYRAVFQKAPGADALPDPDTRLMQMLQGFVRRVLGDIKVREFYARQYPAETFSLNAPLQTLASGALRTDEELAAHVARLSGAVVDDPNPAV